MFYFGGFFYLLIVAFFAIHAIKTGRQQWLWIILFFPLAGCLIYFFVEMVPGFQRSLTVQNASGLIVKTIHPGGKLKKLEEQLAFSDTVDNRHQLAQEYINTGNYQEAVDLYQSCLQGVYEDEPFLILGLANALYLNHSFREAQKRLAHLQKNHPNHKPKEVALLMAKTCQELGQKDEAAKIYKELVKVYPGEEVRCRYALLLKEKGEIQQALELFMEIISGARRSPGYYRRNQRKWIGIARQNISDSE
jgi:hypothetical protein